MSSGWDPRCLPRHRRWAAMPERADAAGACSAEDMDPDPGEAPGDGAGRPTSVDDPRAAPFAPGERVRLLDRAPAELVFGPLSGAVALLPRSMAHPGRAEGLAEWAHTTGGAGGIGALVPLFVPALGLRIGAMAIVGGEVRQQLGRRAHRLTPYSSVTIDAALVERPETARRLGVTPDEEQSR